MLLEDIIKGLLKKIIYSEERIGQHGYSFRLYKFKTMPKDIVFRVEPFWKKFDPNLGEYKNLPLWAKILRRTCMDESPQSYNILRGEMTLVGPRPLIESDLEEFPEDLVRARQEFKSGLINIWYASDKPLTYETIIGIEWAFINLARANYTRAQIYFGLKALCNLATLKQKTI